MNLFLTRSPEEQKQKFLSLENPRDVANLLEIKYNRLVYHLYKVPDDAKYTSFEVPKKSGGVRKINSPVTALKIIQQKLNEVLLNVYKPKPSVFSYIQGKSIVDNAKKHRNRRWVFNVDLENFFPSINFGRVRGLYIGKPYFLPKNVSTVLAQICCFKNQLPQGAPTSPIVSNMICAQMDSQLQELALNHKCVYSRYADDITFSTSKKEFPSDIAKVRSITDVKVGKDLEKIINNNGFKINYKKIRMQPWFRRQQVTGLTVNEFPNVRRGFVRQIRAMLYAWQKFGIRKAEITHFIEYDKKHRNPDHPLPIFKKIVKGKIEYLGMVRGQENQIYKRFILRYKELDNRDKGIPSIRWGSLSEIKKPKVFTEGITDKKILSVAWSKLYDDAEIPFVLLDADPLGGSGLGGGGATALTIELNSKRLDESSITVGLFDRDKDGNREYQNLHKDYKEDVDNDWKVSLFRKSGSLRLPVPDEKTKYAEYENLCIEFYFSESALNEKTKEGYGLEFSFPTVKETVDGKVIKEFEDKTIVEARKIKNGKTVFAERIVPSLERDEFIHFGNLFEKIIQLINEFVPRD